MEEGSKYYTTEEVARLCSVSVRTVRHWIAEGIIARADPPNKFRRRQLTRFDKEYINKFLAEGLSKKEPPSTH